MSLHEEKKNLTPWYSSAEWRNVFQMIYNTELDSDHRYEALNTMKIWKTRTNYLPAGIEGSIEILEAMLYDEYASKCNEPNRREIQMMYSMAIMRFLNMMVDAKYSRVGSLYKTAQNLRIPDWMISMRHDIAHSTKLPALELLRKGAECALHWLYEMYWQLESSKLADCILKQNKYDTEEHNYRQYLERFLMLYGNIVLCMSPENGFKRISEITIPELKREIVVDVNSYLMNQNTYVHEYCSLKSLLYSIVKRINEIVKRLSDTKKCAEIYVDSLLNSKHFLSAKVLREGDRFQRDFMKLWMPMLDHIHVTGTLTLLVKRLINLTCLPKLSEQQLIATVWVEHILKAMAKCKETQKITVTNYVNPPTIKRAMGEVNARLPELRTPIVFRPDVGIDPFFIGLDAIKFTLLNEEGAPRGKYWKTLLHITDKELSVEDIANLEKLHNLVRNQARPNEPKTESSDTEKKIYVVEDLEKFYKKHDTEQNNDTQKKPEITNGSDDSRMDTETIWQRAPEHEDWTKYSLGVLPDIVESME